MTESDRWLHFDVHGRLGIRVEADAPAAAQLRTMLEGFRTDREVAPDIVVSGGRTVLHEASHVEDELRYLEDAVHVVHSGVQVLRVREGLRIEGDGELLTSLLPLLDQAISARGAAMIHAATVSWRGHGVALPAAGGTGKTSTVAKLMRRDDFAFMGDDWAFVSADGDLLGFEKPMFIKPHHKPIYPHLFQGVRKPLMPVRLSRPVGRLTTLVHPYVIRYPRLADVSRRWSPEHRLVRVRDALPGARVDTEAPLALAVYVERSDIARTRLDERSVNWMADRMLGNFNIEMPGFSRELMASLGATSFSSLTSGLEEKETVLLKGLAGVQCHLLRVPSSYPPDVASDEIVEAVEELLAALAPATRSGDVQQAG